MGKGLIPADPETWKVRRRAIVPGFHKAWYNAMCGVFVKCNRPLLSKLFDASKKGTVLNMETEFCSVALDIIGKTIFNYEFGSVTKESPVIEAVYSTLKEVFNIYKKLSQLFQLIIIISLCRRSIAPLLLSLIGSFRLQTNWCQD